ncbi:ADP-ribosylation factor [Musa troglodytarum]|uniref:ADP-ribosylation factor n=1 Tax=Musa troglodytarum TaxID=320322 RepID=A0A9E7FPX0_9LILI|nr:ADP-ribosylation factor [Musa troglodytarum]
MTPMEVCEGLGLYGVRNRVWHIQGTCALRGDGLYEGLDWLAGTLNELQTSSRSTSVASSSSPPLLWHTCKLRIHQIRDDVAANHLRVV